MIKIVLCGAAGRMGREIINATQELEDIKLIAGIEAKGSNFVGSTISDVKIYDDILAVIKDAECVVDFTNHTATRENLRLVKKYKKPWVIGTTGFSQTELGEIKDLSKDFPILLSANMSVGVNQITTLKLLRPTIVGKKMRHQARQR